MYQFCASGGFPADPQKIRCFRDNQMTNNTYFESVRGGKNPLFSAGSPVPRMIKSSIRDRTPVFPGGGPPLARPYAGWRGPGNQTGENDDYRTGYLFCGFPRILQPWLPRIGMASSREPGRYPGNHSRASPKTRIRGSRFPARARADPGSPAVTP